MVFGVSKGYLQGPGSCCFPRESKYPVFEDFGLKSHSLRGWCVGTRVLKYWVLGPSGFHSCHYFQGCSYRPLIWTPIHANYKPYTKEGYIEQTVPESNKAHNKGP